MCSIVAHDNELQLLFQKFAFTNDIVIQDTTYKRYKIFDYGFSAHTGAYTDAP